MTPEAHLIQLLGVALGDTNVYGSVPATRPDQFVTIERTGGPRDLWVDEGMYAIQCWSTNRNKAAAFASDVADAFLSLPATNGRVGSTGVVSIYNFPDPDSGQARYQITANAVVMTES